MIKSDVAAMRDKQASQQDRTALQWLSPLDFSPQYHDIISRKEEGTGQWFLDSTEFMTWQSEAKNTLFCPGIPGAGKTMVSAIAIQNLLTRAGNEDIGLGFLFCNYKSQAEQTCAMLLATLLKQLAHGHSDATELIARMHESHERRNTRPSPEELQGALQSVCSMYPVVYLVVDALDEFVSQDRPRTELIDKLRQLQSKTDVRLLFTSRFVPEIEDDFISDSKLEVRASDEDVRTYVQGQLTRLPKCIQREIGQEVQDKIAEAVDGMYVRLSSRPYASYS
jgi:Cdc6-like AAA superfamily ATPase